MRTGLEPATPGVTGRYSNQLNYRTNCSDLCVFLKRGCKGTQKIRTTKFFAYFFLIFFDLFWLFHFDDFPFLLSLRLLQFRYVNIKNTVLDFCFDAFLVCIVREKKGLTEF